MINAHQFQQAAKKFRGGRITLAEFTDIVFEGQPTRGSGSSKSRSSGAVAKSAQQNSSSGGERSPNGLPWPARNSEAHKGDFGRVLAIGGSQGMAGAISLTGLAALRSGSGLVKVAVPEMIQGLIATFNPCLMTIGCLAEGDVFHGASESSLSHHAEWSDVIALGPGMGRGDAQTWIVNKLYSEIPQPMVVDADGLNNLADHKSDLSQHQGQRILTPHPGELQRLLNSQITRRSELEQAAIELAKTAGVVVVLKGKGTLVTDGSQSFKNDSGNAGMATAGSGDVLTGIITSLIGQGLSGFEACKIGVNVHGIAGDFAAESVGETSLIATDIINFLPNAFKKLANAGGSKIGF